MTPAPPPSTGAAARAVLVKELRLERRAPQTLVAMALFAATSYVVFHFALRRDTVAGDLASGVLWVTLTLAALLGIGRLFVADRDEGGLEGFLLAPVDRTALLFAKAGALLAFLAALEVVAVPLFAVLLLGPTPSAGTWLQLLAVFALADLGIAVVGTLVAAIAVQTRARDLITTILALPLLLPVVIAAARASAPLLAAGGAHALTGRWPAVLGLYDLIFGLLAYALFDFLVED
ncbi:MAG TPA: heme exporter protein CcmB [Solirubrobacteraceae bacterium]|nr:heme exporter protein CcmB [Solirubrobacteraceae bacterium]